MVDSIDLTGKNVEVIYWHNRPQQDQDLLQSMLDEFNKSNPYGITAHAEIAGAAYADVYNKVNAAIQAGQPPEISVAYQNQAAFYRAQGRGHRPQSLHQEQQVRPEPGRSERLLPDLPGQRREPTVPGRASRLPHPAVDRRPVLQRRLAASARLDSPPTDWQAWEQAACKASDPSQNKYGWAMVSTIASDFASMVFSRGGRILSDDGSAYVFNDQSGVDSLALMQRMFKNKCAVEVPASERNGEQNRFANGQVLFVMGSSSGLAGTQDAVSKGDNFKWDIAVLPEHRQAGDQPVRRQRLGLQDDAREGARRLAGAQVPGRARLRRPAGPRIPAICQCARAPRTTSCRPTRPIPKWGAAADSYGQACSTGSQYAMVESPVAGYDPVRDLIDKNLMSRVVTDAAVDPKSILDDVVNQSNAILKENAPRS